MKITNLEIFKYLPSLQHSRKSHQGELELADDTQNC